MWPAAHDEVVAVGALTAKGTRAPFSASGPWVRLLAPGVNVVSNYFGNEVSVTRPGIGPDRDATTVWPRGAAPRSPRRGSPA